MYIIDLLKSIKVFGYIRSKVLLIHVPSLLVFFSFANHDLLITLTSGFVQNNNIRDVLLVLLVRNYYYIIHLALLPMLYSHRENDSQFFFGSGPLKKLFVSFSFPLLFEHAKAKHNGIMKLNVLALLIR